MQNRNQLQNTFFNTAYKFQPFVLMAIIAMLVCTLMFSGCARNLLGGDNQQESATPASTSAEDRQITVNLGKTSRFFDYLKADDSSLYAFLQQMPKGADLQRYAAVLSESHIGSLDDLQGEALVQAVQTFYPPLFNRAIAERISYLEIIARPSSEQLRVIEKLKTSIVEEAKTDGSDWDFRYHFIWPIAYNADAELFAADLELAVTAYYEMPETLAAIALLPPASETSVGGILSTDGIEPSTVESGVSSSAIDGIDESVMKPSINSTSSDGNSPISAAVYDLELAAVAAAFEESKEKHKDRPLDFVDISMGSSLMASNFTAKSGGQEISSVLESTHAIRLTGLNALLRQQDIWGLLEKLKADKTVVALSLLPSDEAKTDTPSTSAFALLRSAGVSVGLIGASNELDDALTSGFTAAVMQYGLSYADLKELVYASVSYTLQSEEAKAEIVTALDEAFVAFEEKMAHRSDEANWK